MKALGLFVAIALALALQTTLARFVVGGSVAVDLVLVAVVAVALTTGPVGGMLAGTAAGLIQDALSSGVVGIGSLAKTIVGFLAGAFGQQFIVTAALPRLVIFVAATVLHGAVFMGLYYVLDLRVFPSPWKPLAAQAMANALVGIIAFGVVESLPGMVERRRSRRGRR